VKFQKTFHRRCVKFLTVAILVLTAAMNARADYQSTVLADNPVVYYALNPGVDGTAIAPDLTGNENDGIAVNISAAWGPSLYITNAANFNGASAIDLSQGSFPDLLNFTGPITLEAWVKPASLSLFADIVAKGYDISTSQEIALRVNGPYGANYFGSSGSVGVSGGKQTTNWTYVVLSSDETNCSLFENGVLVQQSADTSGSVTFADDWVIGNGSSAGNGRLFNGDISEVAIYQHGLTAAQVLTHYCIGLLNSYPSNSPPIIISQPLDQQSYKGGLVTFSVGVASALSTTNQWFKGASPIAGQTNASLTLTNLQPDDAGSYSVAVGNINGTTNSTEGSLFVSLPNNLQWSPNSNTGVWDTGNSPNWVNQANSQQTVFNLGDAVLFDDTPNVPTNVSVIGSVVASVITVNSSSNYFTFSGPGTLTGAGNLVKIGSSILTILAPGNLTGKVVIGGGTIIAANNCFHSVSSITISNNATLDLAGGTFGNITPTTVFGAGLNGVGALYNSYNDNPLESLNITMTGDTKFGASARWDLATGSQISGAYNLTIDWSGGAGYGEWNSVAVAANVAGIALTNGNLGIKYMDTGFQNPGTVFTVSTNCQLQFYNGGWNGSLHVLTGGFVYLWSAPSPFNGSNIVLENGAQWQSYYNSGVEPINSAITLNGIARFVLGDHNLIYTNVISGPGGFVLDKYNHQAVFAASNTYSGPTVIGRIGSDPAVALTGNGSISHSSLIFFGGVDPTSVRLEVTARSDQTFILASGQTLAGVGAVNGNLTVSAGATLSPAGTNTTLGLTTGTNATGAISASGDVTLNGNTILKLNGSGTNDQVQSATSINYGGTLNLVNISSSPLAAANSFKIFNAPVYGGSFALITPATPGANLLWDTNQLSSGIISVVATPTPVISSVTVVSGNLIFGGTGGIANSNYVVLTTTNLALPVTWLPVATNQFNGSGGFSATNAISSGTTQQFYRIQQP
jgi:hypothetical protein